MNLHEKFKKVSHLIENSHKVIVFTGAGISTSCGLPDYRGDNGIRNLQSKKRKRNRIAFNGFAKNFQDNEALYSIAQGSNLDDSVCNFLQLIPSDTHMAIYELCARGYVSHVISQNIDNLHLKSGLTEQYLTELHGNASFAKCDTCGKIYRNNFPSPPFCNDSNCSSVINSTLERRMQSKTRYGNGRLKRWVMTFNQQLDDIDGAYKKCKDLDLAIVLGTSLKVDPFASLATKSAKHLVIINLQNTVQKYDKQAQMTGVQIHAECDEAMKEIMKYLLGSTYDIPKWNGQHQQGTSLFHGEFDASTIMLKIIDTLQNVKWR